MRVEVTIAPALLDELEARAERGLRDGWKVVLSPPEVSLLVTAYREHLTCAPPALAKAARRTLRALDGYWEAWEVDQDRMDSWWGAFERWRPKLEALAAAAHDVPASSPPAPPADEEKA